ncbi:MAG: hypothetical protein JW719_02300 [Pirellulales bacterium]|nr:hypothetical protein [Pirellulales bacterium]
MPTYGTTPQPSLTPVTPGQVAGPVPAYGSTVETPSSTWDPYAPPGSTPPPTLLPQDYYPPVPAAPELTKMQRLIDELRLDYHLLAARGSKKFGTNDLELSTTVALPLFYNKETPLLVTPGFAFHWWEGPVTGAPVPGVLANLPPRVYDAYVGAAWNPQVTSQLGGELAFRVGVYSDFERVRNESIRYTGHGLFNLALSPSFRVKGGVVYYDRVRIKMLPAAGFVWTPNPDTEFDIFFPSPRISRRLWNYGNTEWWLYCRGEYGGGSWTVVDQATDTLEQVDYNDLRFSVGLQFDRMDKIGGLIEVGTAFDRELLVRRTWDKFDPSTTIFLRAGLMR